MYSLCNFEQCRKLMRHGESDERRDKSLEKIEKGKMKPSGRKICSPRDKEIIILWLKSNEIVDNFIR